MEKRYFTLDFSSRGKIADLKIGYESSHSFHPADDLMTRNDWVRGRHHALGFIPGVVKIRVTNATERYLDINIPLCRAHAW